MNKKFYEEPKIEIKNICAVEDIINTSGGNDLDTADVNAGNADWKW